MNFLDFLSFLNQNSVGLTVILSIASVILSVLLVIATLVYAYLTSQLVSETTRMREAQTEPEISITIQPSEEWINFINMTIQNIGSGSAHNIHFKVDPDFECEKGKFVSDIGYIKNGLHYLAPKQKVSFFLTSMVEDSEKKIKTNFEINTIYQNKVGKTYEYSFSIDLSQLEGLIQIGEPPINKISMSIAAMQSDIHSLYTGFHKMNVVMYTKKEAEDERRQQLERQQGKQPKQVKQKRIIRSWYR